MPAGRMDGGPLDLRPLVDGLPSAELDGLGDAVASRPCREKCGADTIGGLLAKWGRRPLCPLCKGGDVRLDGTSNVGRSRFGRRSCGARSGVPSGTVFASAKLPPHKITRIVEAMCHDVSLRLIETVREVSRSTAFPWRYKVSSTVGGWQGKAVLSGRVRTDEMCFC